jgi:EmrB/QacA subfamily drug resistance transporter
MTPTKPRAGWTLALVSVALFMTTLDNLVVSTALPSIRADLGASIESLQWTVNAYTLSFAVLLLTGAALGDRFGRRRMFMVGIGVFTAASLFAALAPTTGALVAARAVQGLGAALVLPLTLTLLSEAVTVERRGLALGVWAGVSGLGVALGPVIGGAVVEGVSWQAIFWLNVPVALVAIPLLVLAVPESRGAWQRLDPVGTTLIGGAVFLGIWGIVHGNDDGWSDPRVLGPLVVAALLVPAYLRWARVRAHAVLPLRLFSSRGFSVSNVIALFFTLGMFGTVFLLSQYLQIVQGYTPLEAGLRTLPWTAAPMVVAPIAGVIAPRTGLRPLLAGGLILQTASLVWFARLTETGAAYPSFVPALLLAGVGMGLTFAPMATAVLQGLPEQDFAMASSANSTIREFGVALGIAVLTAVFLGNGGTLDPRGYDGAIGPALLTGAAAVAVAAIASVFAPGRGRPSAPRA